MAKKIKALWPYVHHDVLTRLNIGCESFRGELETQLNRVSNIQGDISQGVPQFAHAVDSRLIQNNQRNETKEGMIKELYTAARNLVGK